MALSSMTGFARASGSNDQFQWNWEVKSVNNKGLDVRVKFPSMLDGFDLTLKKKVAEKLFRGSVFVSLSVERGEEDNDLKINTSKLDYLIDLAAKYTDKLGVAAPSLDGLLAVKGVIEADAYTISDDMRSDLEAELLKSFDDVLDDLSKTRADEGARMQVFLEDQLSVLRKLTDDAKSNAEKRPEIFRDKFEAQVNKLLGPDNQLDPERLAQEMAILAVKADIQEELDRLDSHFVEANKLIKSSGPTGRKLDFLCQEFNREVNTICSKSSDSSLTAIGIEMKTVIDQFREQVQNIE